MSKNNRHILFCLCIIPFCVGLSGMESVPAIPSCLSLPIDIIQNMMKKYCDFQSIGRLGQTCRIYNTIYRDIMMCKNPTKNECSLCGSIGCFIFKKNFNICTDRLAIHAKKYKNIQNDDDLMMFKYLWRYHAQEREKGVNDVLDIATSTWQDRIDVYAGDCCNRRIKKEMEAERAWRREKGWEEIEAINEEMINKKIIINSIFLKNFLHCKNTSAVKTILLDEYGFDLDVIQGRKLGFLRWKPDVDLNWYLCDKQLDYKTTVSILEYACKLGELDIIEKLIHKCSETIDDHFFYIICSVISDHNIELVKSLIKKYPELTDKYRLRIFGEALKCDDQVMEIMELLFSNDIDGVKDSLLYDAVSKRNTKIVYFLLKKGASIDIVDNYRGRILDYLVRIWFYHCESQGIYTTSHELNYIKCLELLVEYGADINAIDEKGRTLLMRLALIENYSATLEYIVPALIKLGAKIDIVDKAGDTPLSIAHPYCLTDIRLILNNLGACDIVDGQQTMMVPVENKIEVLAEPFWKYVINLSICKIGLVILCGGMIYYLVRFSMKIL